MKFTTATEVKNSLIIIDQKAGDKRRVYPIQFKRSLIEFWRTSEMTLHAFSESIDLPRPNLVRWNKQYDDGLYAMEGAYTVSPTSLDINQAILRTLREELADIESKIDLVEQCEKAGLVVSMTAIRRKQG